MEVKISNLPPATEVKGGEELPVVQDGATKKMKREDFLGQSDWNCFDEKSSDYIKNKPCYKYEKEIEYTRLTLDKPVNEAIFPGFFNHGKKLGLVEGVAYTVDIISAEKTDTLQLTAIDFSSELDGFSPGTVIGLMNEASYFQLFDGVAVKDLLAGTFIPADDALYGIDDLSVQSIVIHGISSVETKLQKLPKEYLNTEELNVPIRKVITISNDDLPVTSEEPLNPAFKVAPEDYYIIVNHDYLKKTFQLALSTKSEPVNQVFNYATDYLMRDVIFVEFSEIGANWKMRPAGADFAFIEKKPEGYSKLEISAKSKAFAYSTVEYTEGVNTFLEMYGNDLSNSDDFYQGFSFVYAVGGGSAIEIPYAAFMLLCAPTEGKKARIIEYEAHCQLDFGDDYIHLNGNVFNRPLLEGTETIPEKPEYTLFSFSGFGKRNEGATVSPKDAKYIIWNSFNYGDGKTTIPNGTEIILTWSK